ncbi:HNH endonuclease signature motif containing protein [Lacisediminihabitans sp. FW035]
METTAVAAPELDRATDSLVLTPALTSSFLDTMGELIDDVAEADRVMAQAAAHRAALIDQARSWSEATSSLMPADTSEVRRWSAAAVARRSLVSELAAALRLPERTTENLIEESRFLLRELPATLSALSDGDISYRHAQAMIDHAGSLPVEARRSFEEAALPFALTLTASRFDHRVRVLRERAHPESIEVRHATCRDKRELSLDPARDGMAWLTAYLPADTAHAIFQRATDAAVSLQGEGETRTLTQLRADVFADLLIDGTTDSTHHTPNLGAGIRARVLVTVPVLSLLGHGTEPAVLEGYGPIDLATARQLAAGAPGFVRILTHPETGAVLSLGRDRYAIPPDLRAWLRMRDETCRAPGCGAPARRCDLDHTQDWQHRGPSNHDNLAHLCPKHHDQKHHTRWSVEHLGGGDLEWTSPTGHRYVTEPATRMEPPPLIE